MPVACVTLNTRDNRENKMTTLTEMTANLSRQHDAHIALATEAIFYAEDFMGMLRGDVPFPAYVNESLAQLKVAQAEVAAAKAVEDANQPKFVQILDPRDARSQASFATVARRHAHKDSYLEL